MGLPAREGLTPEQGLVITIPRCLPGAGTGCCGDGWQLAVGGQRLDARWKSGAQTGREWNPGFLGL